MGVLLLLLWKNFVQRKRQKIRLVVEIVWPLAIFLIFMWVRQKELKEYYTECHFDAKAMPSAGVLINLQTYICALNNTCLANSNEDGDSVETYNSSMVTRFLLDLDEIAGIHLTPDVLTAIRELSKDIPALIEMTQNIRRSSSLIKGEIPLRSVFQGDIEHLIRGHNVSSSDKIADFFTTANLNLDGISHMSSSFLSLLVDPKMLFCNEDNFGRLISPPPNNSKDGRGGKSSQDEARQLLCDMDEEELNKLMLELAVHVDYGELEEQLVKSADAAKSTDDAGERQLLPPEAFAILRRVAENLRKVESLINALSKLQQNFSTELQNVFFSNETGGSMERTAARLFCGNAAASFLDRKGGTSGFGRLALENRQIQFQSRRGNFEYDDSVSKSCNEIFSMFENESRLRVIWHQVKPFIRGKILYYPDTPVVRSVMKRVNSTFAVLALAKRLSHDWITNYGPYATDILVNDSSPLHFWMSLLNPSGLRATSIGNEMMQLALRSQLTSGGFKDDLDTLERATDDLKPPLSMWLERVRDMTTTMEYVDTLLGCYEFQKLEAFNDSEKLMKRAMKLNDDAKLWAAVEFTNVDGYNDALPAYVKYKIRMDAYRVDKTPNLHDRIAVPGPRGRPPFDLKYQIYGFIHLQDMVERAIIREQTGADVQVGMWTQQFPYPCFVRDRFIIAIARSFPMFMVLAWVYTAAMIIKSIVYEKEKRLKEVMRTMGLGNAVHWVGWFITSFVMMLLSVFFLTLIFKYGVVLEHSDPTLIFSLLVAFSCATISMSFLISTVFSRANLAAAAGGILYFVTFLPYSLLTRMAEVGMDKSWKVVSSLLSNVCFGFGCHFIAVLEENGVGVQWDNFYNSNRSDVDYTLLEVMAMLLFDSVLYMLLAFYIEAVFPGEFGVPQKWYYFVTWTYWFGHPWNKQAESDDKHAEIPRPPEVADDYEPEPTHLPLGVSVKNLSKTYPDGKVAIDNLSVNFYENQITSFLGHNGAGKTTTISILLGIIPPTSGTAEVYGLDIRTRLPEIRRNLGACPQHNVLFDYLTVDEHLWFYSRLKGCQDSKELREEIDKMVFDIGLPHKRRSKSDTLSGGMQRKLSIGIAFIGGSKTVFLDEPTSGVDPYSRRGIWDLLLHYKEGRTIILTTHFMDEADLLGDRIAIIAQGRLQCCGSSLFLKGRFGSGYYLTFVKQESAPSKPSPKVKQPDTTTIQDIDEGVADLAGSSADSQSDRSDVSAIGNGKYSVEPKVTAFLRRFVPNVHLVEDIGLELSYILPTKDREGGEFERLFDALESHLHELGVQSYGVSDTTLEEVFLKVGGTTLDEQGSIKSAKSPYSEFYYYLTCGCCLSSRKRRVDPNRSVPTTLAEEEDSTSAAETTRLNAGAADDVEQVPYTQTHGIILLRQQFSGLIVKRFYHSTRNRKGLFAELVLPALFVCIAMLFTLLIPQAADWPPLELTPWAYKSPNYVFHTNLDPGNNWTRHYDKTLGHPPHFGTRCVSGRPLGLSCIDITECTLRSNMSMLPTPGPCQCEKGEQTCSADALGKPPPQMMLATTDFLIHMNGRNIADWLVKTNLQYYKNRYGGVSFGLSNDLAKNTLSPLGDAMEKLKNAFANTSFNGTSDLFAPYDPGMVHLHSAENIKVWYNNRGWIASIAYLNAINNLLLRAHLPPDKNSASYGISVTNHPVNLTTHQMTEELMHRANVALLLAICIIFALSFVPASFVLILIDERVSKFKHLQFVSGVKIIVYWAVNFLWDMLCYLIVVALCVLIFIVFDEQAFVSKDNIGGLILLLVLYGFATIPLMYPASFFCDIPSTAFVTLAVANLFIGMVSTTAAFVLEIMQDDELQEIASVLKVVFLVLPQYCLGRGLIDMVMHQATIEAMKQYGLRPKNQIFDWDFLGRNMFCMVMQAMVGCFLTLMIEYKFFVKRTRRAAVVPGKKEGEEDEDVARERKRVLSEETSSSTVLKVVNLSKVYASFAFMKYLFPCKPRYRKGGLNAVKNLCFSVEQGECFGLLGVNGAGKTTTFKMLTGDTRITEGDAFVLGNSVKRDKRKVYQYVGYCPQFDALDGLLTAREHLVLFAKLKGVPSKDASKVADMCIQKMGLRQYADRQAGNFSGGNKRKLSTAIALVGDPKIIFLDEPTTGMDPKAKRFLWNSIIQIVREGRCVVLTSHSMEECEALCTRLAIMVNGEFKCIGSIQHLKNRFGQGYTLTIRIKGTFGDLNPVIDFVHSKFDDAMLREQRYNQVQFQIPTKNLTLSKVFREMENARQDLNVEDYSITQTTLDQVFINFAKEQSEYEEEEQAVRGVVAAEGGADGDTRGDTAQVTELLLDMETSL